MRKLWIVALLAVFVYPNSALAVSNGGVSNKAQLTTEYAHCVVATDLETSRSSVLRPVYWQRMTKIKEELSVQKCVEQSGGFDPLAEFSSEAVRYAVARVLVKREFSAYRPFDFATLPPLKHGTPAEDDPTKGLSDKDFNSPAMAFFLMDHLIRTSDSKAGDCIVRNDSKASWNVIVNGTSSDKARDLISQMGNTLSDCITGNREFAVSQLVGMLSVNYYRLAIAKQKQEEPDA